MRFRHLLTALLICITTAALAMPITPQPAGTKTISATSVTSATAIATPASPSAAFQLEITNAGTATVFLEFGTAGQTAVVATGYPVLAGQTKVVTVPSTTTHVGAITGSGTATVYVTTGQGE